MKKNLFLDSRLGCSRHKESALMRNLPGMAYRILNDGLWSIDYVSEGCLKLFGEEPYRLICDKPTVFANLVHEDRYSGIIKRMEEAMNLRKPYKIIYRINSLTEKDKWIWDQGEGIFSDDGKIIAAVGFMTDFTEHKEMEHELRQEILRLKSGENKANDFPEIIGSSPAIKKIFSLMRQCAGSDANIIVTGESGTGKELVSRAIHRKSNRNGMPFVPVNCGAIPENLLESEFFGCAKGAFSGATSTRQGILDRADCGTLFLDEIGEIAPAMQAKLLRAIEGGGYTAVGSTKIKKPDIRIIAATNKNLQDLVNSGKMREDFYYRINVIPISLPPLRDRLEDIPLLIDHFLKNRKEVPFPEKNKLSAMGKHNWPGNVRELQNIISRYVITGEISLPQSKDTVFCINSGNKNLRLKTILKDYEKNIIKEALNQSGSNKTKTALYLGIDRRTLFSKIKEYKLG